SGVNSLRVGDIYYVGHLPWWERLWYALSTHPVLLAVIAVVLVVISLFLFYVTFAYSGSLAWTSAWTRTT
ncbi:hypothetical protein, partial [Escherichia coli]|uniref:hypothetical protein n=1 Tax=Escherichia coli TaxID=562 RepID=UPI0013D33EC0